VAALPSVRLPVHMVADMGDTGSRAQGPQAASGPVRPGQVAIAILHGPVSLRTWLATASLAVSVLAGACVFPLITAALIVSGALAGIPAAGMPASAFTGRLSARLARFDRWRVRHLGGQDIGPAPLLNSADSPLRLAGYQLARFPAAAALAFLAYVWWANTIVLLLLPVSPGPGFPIVFSRWRLGEVVLTPAGAALGCALGIVFVLAGVQILRAAAAIDAGLARTLLGPSRLSSEVARLSQARALAVEAAESERRRIERDLHDGFQPRLVSLAAQLGLAMARLDRDPAAARPLVGRAHGEAKTALADLRHVIRGIHPPVLDERGLDAALSGLVAGCPVPVRVDLSLPARPDRTREAIAYFVAAEAITNITRHSGAQKASVTITGAGGSLAVLVEDDGRGGAAARPGGGLAGLAARAAAVDGTLTITSPPGGPTRVEAVLPCAW
jgi:signal transduction histidine kinase